MFYTWKSAFFLPAFFSTILLYLIFPNILCTKDYSRLILLPYFIPHSSRAILQRSLGIQLMRSLLQKLVTYIKESNYSDQLIHSKPCNRGDSIFIDCNALQLSFWWAKKSTLTRFIDQLIQVNTCHFLQFSHSLAILLHLRQQRSITKL